MRNVDEEQSRAGSITESMSITLVGWVSGGCMRGVEWSENKVRVKASLINWVVELELERLGMDIDTNNVNVNVNVNVTVYVDIIDW